MKKRRLIALLLALVLCMTACAPAAEVEQTKEPQASQEANAPEAETPKEYWQMLDEVKDTSELPDWTGDTLEITLWKAAGTNEPIYEDATETVVWEEIERVTGVRLNYNETFNNGGDNISAKLPQVIASNILPTIVHGYNIDAEMMELWENDYLLDLTDYYEKGWLDHVKASFGGDAYDTEVFSNLRDDNGQYYMYPSSCDLALFASTGYTTDAFDPNYYMDNALMTKASDGLYYEQVLYVRDDMLKAVIPEALSWKDIESAWLANGTYTEDVIFDTGMETKDDFWNLLYAMKDLAATGKYVDAAGTPVEIFAGPNSDADNWGWMNNLPRLVGGVNGSSSYFTYANDNPTSKDDLFGYSFSSDFYTDFARDLNKLVRDDVIAQNSLVDNSATFTEKRANGHYAVIYNDCYGTLISDLNAISDEWDYRPVFINHNNSEQINYMTTRGTLYTNAIFKDAVPEDQVEQLIHFIDYMFSEVGVKNSYWGPATAGLFTEDAEGNRTYATEELKACLHNNEDNGENLRYGLQGSNAATRPECFPADGITAKVNDPDYILLGQKGITADDAVKRYNPGILDGRAQLENVVGTFTDCALYGLGLKVESLAEFWNTRPAFEAQMKRAIAAASDAEFEAEWQELIDMAVDAGCTDEALKEFSNLFYEGNKELLQAAGIVS